MINSPIYLDLGSALAAFGLIFAVYQLRKPQWELILRIRSGWQSNLIWIFGGIGLFLVLVRIVLPQEWLIFLPSPFNIPLTYEVAAYLFFIASPVSLLYFSTKSKGLFNKDTSRKFYESLVWEISKTSDDNVNAALGVLLPNFNNICKATKEHGEKEEIHQSASAILDVILSDAAVVKILTTKKLNALQYIFATIEKHNINRRDAGIGIPTLVRNLFYDKDSFFYKHLHSREGLALPLNIYETIFDSSLILTNFELFGYPTLGYSTRKEVGLTGINVFIEALSRAVKTYLKTGNVPARHINDGLEHLSRIFGDLCLTISIEEKRGVDTKYSLKDEWWGLNEIAYFLGHNYPFLAHDEELNQEVAEKEKTTTEADFYSYSTINAGIAAALYKAFEQLSYIENTTDTYHTVLDLLDGMMHESERKEGYREPFAKRMWEQIGNNVVKRHYPAALRVYLVFIGFCLGSDSNQRQGWIGEQAERMRRLLYVDLKPLLDEDVEMVNKEKMKDALLPQLMDYKEGHFTYRFGFGQGEEKIISTPTENTTSALEGVDLEHHSKV
jgi:hypothetical protein